GGGGGRLGGEGGDGERGQVGGRGRRDGRVVGRVRVGLGARGRRGVDEHRARLTHDDLEVDGRRLARVESAERARHGRGRRARSLARAHGDERDPDGQGI